MLEALIWPGVVVICVIAALLILRSAFMGLIGRVSKAGKDGVSFDRPQERSDPHVELSFDVLMKLPISATVLEREKLIKEQLQTFGLKDDAEKIGLLTRTLAITRIESEFNNIAYVIFGSQVSLLIQLTSTSRGLPLSIAQELFNKAQADFPYIYEERSFEDWFNYLQSSNLLTHKDSKIDITQTGTDFLKHLVDARLTYERKG